MKTKLMQLAVIAFAFLVSGIAFAFPSSYDNNSRVYGADELAQARAQATRENKLIIVQFTLPNCPPCRYVDNQLRREVIERAYRGKYVFVEDMTRSTEGGRLARRYGVLGAPTFLVLAPTGEGRCVSRGAFGNETEAIALGMNLEKVTSWPSWPESPNAWANPRCLDVIRQSSLQ